MSGVTSSLLTSTRCLPTTSVSTVGVKPARLPSTVTTEFSRLAVISTLPVGFGFSGNATFALAVSFALTCTSTCCGK